MQHPRPLRTTAAVAALFLLAALGGVISSAVQAQVLLRADDPSERQLREAVQVLRAYLAARRAEQPSTMAGPPVQEEVQQRLSEQRADTRIAGNLTTEDAPALGDASISIDQQLHLADASAVFKNSELFLWDDTGSGNLALGRAALSSATGTATNNTAVGHGALQNTVEGGYPFVYGSSNSAVGNLALYSNTTGNRNTAMGDGALYGNETGGSNTSIGFRALFSNTTGSLNTALGLRALYTNTTGGWSTAVGQGALQDSTGAYNTAIGTQALANTTTGARNSAVGTFALFDHVSGSYNVAIGYSAGISAPTNASNNIFIANSGNAGDSTPTIRIGKDGTQTRAFIAGIDGNVVAGSAVQVTASGELGVDASSQRFKQAVEPLADIGERLLALRPVTFQFDPQRVSGGGGVRVGLIAEEVVEVFPELVTRDLDGEPFSVRYDLLSVLLLDEYQRQIEDSRRLEQRLDEVLNRLSTIERNPAFD